MLSSYRPRLTRFSLTLQTRPMMQVGNCRKHSELLDSTPRVGSKYEIGFSFIGREMSFKGEITHLVPNELYAFKVVEGPFTTQVLVSNHIRKVRGLNGCLKLNQVVFGVLPPALLKRWCSPSSKRCRQSSSIGSEG